MSFIFNRNVSAPVKGRATNNCGEIQAAIEAIQIALEYGIPRLCINSDSHLLIKSATQWMEGWKQNGWRKPDGSNVVNQRDFEKLDSAMRQFNRNNIYWNYVEAHSGNYGNEQADRLAKNGARMYRQNRGY